LTALFQLDFYFIFAKKRNLNQKLKNEVIPEGFQFARREGKKGLKILKFLYLVFSV
jgi:hypothetical protein